MARILFLAAHPDDIEYYMGGTVAEHVAAGDECNYSVMSRGEKGVPFWVRHYDTKQLVERRTREAQRGAKLLGMKDMRHYHVPDMAFVAHEDMIRANLEHTWSKFPSDIVYLPEYAHSFYPHPDHLAVGRLGYEVYQTKTPRPIFRHYHTFKPTRFYSVTPFRHIKREAIKAHKSQFWVVFPLKVAILGLLWPLYFIFAARAGSLSFEFYREA